MQDKRVTHQDCSQPNTRSQGETAVYVQWKGSADGSKDVRELGKVTQILLEPRYSPEAGERVCK
jgi:hypothetical protein